MRLLDKLEKKLNKRRIGILFAAVLPIVTLFILWQVQLGDRSLKEFTYYLVNDTRLQTALLTYAILPNMFIFYFVNFRWRWDSFTTGLVATTIFLVLIIAVLILL